MPSMLLFNPLLVRYEHHSRALLSQGSPLKERWRTSMLFYAGIHDLASHQSWARDRQNPDWPRITATICPPTDDIVKTVCQSDQWIWQMCCTDSTAWVIQVRRTGPFYCCPLFASIAPLMSSQDLSRRPYPCFEILTRQVPFQSCMGEIVGLLLTKSAGVNGPCSIGGCG